ncbi:hypothetical protein [Neorhizobium galegae]|uniref:hypothetical protein n=1 Tax=Neorhizobium galegae TaxID=399 RepID=UPI0006222CD5|nr:hypothetical protein [Neorhizobium galegae]CDZ28812.1 Hypothetical protein NGAL_HAMBI490_36730 [Neorhizobium galegae bv. officinalis]MCM2496409.1 hypothetical protein [Neorhizobium galegae]MCQ1770455.1 hypothetical protein [Neorhizobium galegae]MCQ1777360.1 hypothetical protein [Neorhizobium galegae]MCQ1796946.1 hypothetical protein [Neorhizobium galegae]
MPDEKTSAVGEADADERRAALERIRAFTWDLPEGWKFDREEANSRETNSD